MSSRPLSVSGAPGTAAPEKRRSSGFALVAKLLVSLILLAAIARSIDLSAVGTLLLALSPLAAVAAVLSLVGIAVVSALRWWLVMGAIGTPQPLGRVLGLMFVGSFFTQMLPTSVGGDAVRIWQLSRHGVAMDRAFIGVMLERISGLLALVLMVVGGVFWLGEGLSPAALQYILLASLPVLLAGLFLLCCLDRLPPSLQARPLIGGGLRLLAAMAADTRRVLLAPGLSLLLLLLSAAAQVFSILAFFFLARGLGLDLGLPAVLAVVPAIILITFLPISFAGWGVREGASIAMLGAVGLNGDQAVALSVVFGLALILAGLPGCWLWLRNNR
ncbi:flippase-like domain-containing protein [Pelagibius litoralis]|uniref:Flippase-like domain-containing protein n=1 Tax=Pelagibius litoralis TaxID=374515 RepID=A0A967F3V0_9PROT|nr:lysylphosphatidylglycerol synthase transmembrane domain-containing protein [Pelagibius litoralis]NIA72336.1 flippase-like domain-containing protein [Pelagibius litoralis]